MRDELKATVYVASPVKSSDAYNKSQIDGYENLAEHKPQVVFGDEKETVEAYGARPDLIVNLVFDEPDQAVEVEDGYALYLEQPIADAGGLYQNPPYIVETNRQFGHIRVITGRKQA